MLLIVVTVKTLAVNQVNFFVKICPPPLHLQLEIVLHTNAVKQNCHCLVPMVRDSYSANVHMHISLSYSPR